MNEKTQGGKETQYKKKQFVHKMNIVSCFNSKINKLIVAGLTHNRHQFDQLTELCSQISVLYLIVCCHRLAAGLVMDHEVVAQKSNVLQITWYFFQTLKAAKRHLKVILL